MRLLRLNIAVFLAFATPLWGQVARPEHVSDTLQLMQQAFEKYPFVEQVEIHATEAYLSFQLNGRFQISFPETLHGLLQQEESAELRQSLLNDFTDLTIASMQNVAPDRPLDLARIYPVLRPKSFANPPDVSFSQYQPEPYPDDEDEEQYSAPVSHPFVGELRVYFVEHKGQIIQFVTQRHLQQLELETDELYEIARSNMLLKNWPVRMDNDAGVHSLRIGGDFETGMLLDHSFWKAISHTMGTLVAGIPHKDLILFADAEKPAALAQLKKRLVAHLHVDIISSAVLRWEGTRWVMFE